MTIIDTLNALAPYEKHRLEILAIALPFAIFPAKPKIAAWARIRAARVAQRLNRFARVQQADGAPAESDEQDVVECVHCNRPTLARCSYHRDIVLEGNVALMLQRHHADPRWPTLYLENAALICEPAEFVREHAKHEVRLRDGSIFVLTGTRKGDTKPEQAPAPPPQKPVAQRADPKPRPIPVAPSSTANGNGARPHQNPTPAGTLPPIMRRKPRHEAIEKPIDDLPVTPGAQDAFAPPPEESYGAQEDDA